MRTRSVGSRLSRTLELFLKGHYKPGKPLLVGLSGGHDSRTLFELLLTSRRRFPLELHAAHVDHGWREESSQEAQELKKLVESQGCSFFLHRLERPEGGGNLEEKGREARYAFFQTLYRKNDCQALLLGHQADDQVETVLKRLFEGAHFTSLGAMRSHSLKEGMTIWRPLLEHTREEICDFLREMGISALDDRTNYDPAFLRARMRIDLLPFLENVFGKSIRGNIVEFAKSFQELKAYFLEKSTISSVKRLTNPDGVLLDFSMQDGLSPIEIEVALKVILQEEGVILGTRHLKQIAKQIVNGAVRKRLNLQKRQLVIDRKCLLIAQDS